MSNTFSKSSVYVNSLVGFTLDTKPYHSKLTEVAVEYRFEDAVNVSIIDAVASRMVKKAGWLYNYYSGGDVNNKSFGLKRVVLPGIGRTEHNTDSANTPGGFKVGRDEVTDMLGVPLVFNKKATVGIADAWLQRSGGGVEFLTQGNDFHHNYGSMEFRVSAASPTDTDQSPRWQETRAEGVLAEVTSSTRYLANRRIDETQPWSIANSDPASANYRIRQVLNAIQAQLLVTPNPSAQANLDTLFATLNTPDLPQTYEALWATLEEGGTPVISNPETGIAYTGWRGEDGTPAGSTYVDDHISRTTPSAYFFAFSDQRMRESGNGAFDDHVFPGFTVSNIQSSSPSDVDAWVLTITSVSPIAFEVAGETHGFVGAVAVGNSFNTSFVSFDTSVSGGTPAVGDIFVLVPKSRIVVAPDAPMEVWNLIKTDPLAHSRPTFSSTRYGYITDVSGNAGAVSVLDPSIPTGIVTLTAVSATSFTITSSVEPTYTGTATVNTPFNDGRLAFTIRPGTAQPFVAGDKFVVSIVNNPARAEGLDLYYGYDLDSYDNQTSVYDNQNLLDPNYNRPIDFKFDSRFTDYNLAALNLHVAETAVSGRMYRLVALSDGPGVDILHSDGVTINNYIDLASPGGGSVPVFSMPGDANPAPDIRVFEANSFKLERSSDGGATWSVVEAAIPVGTAYSNSTEGVSFTLAQGSKPFIGVRIENVAMGGDVFMWTVVNDAPVVYPAPVTLTSQTMPRIIMHTGSFWEAPGANWTITFSSSSEYTVSAIYSGGPLSGTTVPGYPMTGNLDVPGAGTNRNVTFRSEHVHFTFVRGWRGFATGDTFKFSTLARKPSILVHGSVSGWQGQAEIGRWYWNGKIGFIVNPPVAGVFKSGVSVESSDVDFAKVTVNRVRPDAPSLVYTFERLVSADFGVTFTVSRSDAGVVGHCTLNSTFRDEFVTIDIEDPSSTFSVYVQADSIQFWNAKDTIVVRPPFGTIPPAAADFLNFKKATVDRIAINLDYSTAVSSPDTTALGLTAVDAALIDISTGGVPIQVHSPEATIFNGWLPLTLDAYDAVTSLAHFPDEATEVRVKSAVSGEDVGRIYSDGTINEPVRFEWDESFFTKYLPLNASSNVVVYNSFLNEDVSVLMSERVNFLQSGGVLFEDALFNDNVNVSIAEQRFWDMRMRSSDAFSTTIADGPFAGYLAGYDNLLFDLETNTTGQFDTGSPLTDNFMRAKFLSAIVSPSAAEIAELTTLSALVNDYLVGGSVASTSLPQFLSALDLDTFASTGTPSFGIPQVGAAIDVNQASSGAAAASVAESITMVSIEDANLFDEEGFDAGGLDTEANSTAIMMATSGLPIPSTVAATYAELDTPLFSSIPVRNIEVSFVVNLTSTPTFQFWTPGAPNAVPVAAPVQISARRWRFSLAAESEVKVIVT